MNQMDDNQTGRNQIIWILFIILLALTASVVIIVAAYFASQARVSFYPFVPRSVRINAADIELFYIARTLLSTLNMALILVLIINYVGIYLKTRSQFTIGLVLFAMFFFVKEVAWSPFIVSWAGFGAFGLGPFAFLPDMFELVALSILLYLSIKY